MFKFFKGLKIPKHYRLWLVIGGSLIVLTGISFFIYRSVASAAGISLPGLPNIPSLPTIPGAVTGYFGDLTINVTDRLGNPIPNAEVKFVGSYKNSKSSKTLPSCTTQTLKTDGSGLAKFFEREDRKDNGKLIKKNLRIGTLPKNGKTKDYNSCVYTIYVNADGYYPSPIKNK